MGEPLSLVGAGRGLFMEQHGSGAEKAVRRDAAGRWMLRLHVDSQVIAVQIHAGRCGPLPELTLRAGQCGSPLHALVDLVPDAATQRESGREFRSEEHTSELQSPCNLVCRLLLENIRKQPTTHQSDNMTL